MKIKKVWEFLIFFVPLCFPWVTWASEWHCMTVDSAGSGEYGIALALDSRGYPHIVYRKPYFGTMYASWDGSKWCVGALSDSLGNLTYKKNGLTHYALIIDNQDYPHIVAYGQHIWKDESGWHKTRCDGYDDPSIVFDNNDYLHISSSSICNAVKYTYQNEEGWHSEYVDALSVCSGSSIGLNGNCIPYIAYCAAHTPSQSGLFLATRDTLLGWLFEFIDSIRCYAPSMELDSLYYPHIAYGYSCLKYATKSGESWHIETVDTLDWVGEVSLALAKTNCPYISYRDKSCLLKCAWWDGMWHVEKVDSMCTSEGPSLISSTTSIAVDKEGYAHIAYRHQFSWEKISLRYATNRPLSAKAQIYFLKEKR